MGLNELELPELKHIPKVKFDSGTYENLLSTINLMSYEEVKNLGFKGIVVPISGLVEFGHFLLVFGCVAFDSHTQLITQITIASSVCNA